MPIIPGATDPVETVEEVLRLGEEVGYPLIVKAAAGGGGKGMKLVAAPDEAERAFESAQREGEKYFADSRVYVERYLEDPRHVEVQVLADAHGNVIHLGERDCTIQRRHQKLIEETPSPAVDDALRERIGRIAVDAARAAGYRSAGTIEGLLTADGEYYFMEMNTRIQVEHTVTEEVTGIDLVREQILDRGGRAALRPAGGRAAARPRDRVPDQRGGRRQRLPARARAHHRLPRAGRPRGPGRLGRRRRLGDHRSLRPDDREADRARRRPRARADADAPRARRVRARRPADAARLPQGAALAIRASSPARPATASSSRRRSPQRAGELTREAPQAASSANGRVRPRATAVEVGGRRYDVTVLEPEPPWAELARRRRERAAHGPGGAGSEAVVTPMQGTVLKVEVAEGDEIEAGKVRLHRRGDEDGERDRRAPPRESLAGCRSRPGTPSRAGR